MQKMVPHDDMIDYVILPKGSAPPDYPFEKYSDQFSQELFASDYDIRRQEFVDFVLRNPAPTNINGLFFELIRLFAGGSPHLGVIEASLEYISAHREGADLVLHGILRLLYQFSDHPIFHQGLLSSAEQTILNFKYWPDETGIDSMCSWTEDHFISFAAADFLAGQLYPTMTFTNSGRLGAEKMTLSRPRILKWLDLRFATGFSDWLSNISYDTDLLALLSLVDFCKEEEIRLRAAMVIDLILFDIAANSYAGVFGSSHGRSFEQSVKWASQENTTDTQKLLFGRGVFSGSENLSAFAFALSQRYRMPHSIFGIANDLERPEMLQRQRMGIHIDQAEWWGLKPDGFENGMHLLTMGAYLHPKTARLFIKMLDKFHWWGNKLLRPYNARKWFLKILRLTGLLSFTMRLFEYDACRSSHEEVNLYTYRTPDFMLSSAQDYQKGFGGDQHQIWQATLGPDAVCFTTHPARHQGLPPNYWTGSGFLPRVAQIKNVAIIIYRLEKKPALFVQNELLMTHAWLPRGKFDETVEEDGWIFARYGDGFLALFSQHPYKWQHKPGQDQFNEIIVQARDNIWVCELGRRSTDVSFSNFRARILQAPLLFSHLSVSYLSPSQGQIAFGWDGPLSLDGRVISQKDYPRYGSPYSQTSFPTEIISINFESQNLTLNWKTIDRQSDSYI